MDIRKFAGAGALMLAIAACGSGDEDALMGVGANALAPEQVDAALGPELGNEGGVPENESLPENALVESEAVEAAEEAEPPAPARPRPREEAADDAPAAEPSAEEPAPGNDTEGQ